MEVRSSLKFHIIGWIVCCANLFATTANSYVVQSGDVLTQVIHRNIPGKVWGKNGSLAQVLKLNPQIVNPDRIFPGQEIDLGVSHQRSLASVSSQETSEEFPTRGIPAEPAVAAQIPSSEVNQNSSEIPGSVAVSIIPSFKITELKATDRTTGGVASLRSSLHFDVAGRYHQQWSPKTKSFLGISLGYFSPEKPTDTRKSLSDASKITSGISIGLETKTSERSKFGLSLRYQKELFVRAVSSSLVTVDALNVPSVGASLGYEVARVSKLAVGVQIVSAVTLPANSESYSARLGMVYGGNITIAHGELAETFLGFLQRQQNTSFTNQTETNFLLNTVFRFGGSQE